MAQGIDLAGAYAKPALSRLRKLAGLGYATELSPAEQDAILAYIGAMEEARTKAKERRDQRRRGSGGPKVSPQL